LPKRGAFCSKILRSARLGVTVVAAVPVLWVGYGTECSGSSVDYDSTEIHTS